MSSYGKNQKKIKEYFGEMGQKDQFWTKTAKFGPKNQIWKKFGHFLKDQKISSYGKNQKKLRKRLEEMGQKEHFFTKNDQILAKKSKTRILPGIFFRHFLKDQKISSYGKNQKKRKKGLEEMGQKEHFLPKMAKFWPKSRKREFSPGIFFRNFWKDQKISSYSKNQKKLK